MVGAWKAMKLTAWFRRHRIPHVIKNDVLGKSKLIGAVIILNGPSLCPELLQLIWPLTEDRPTYPVICADGGANLLFDSGARSMSGSQARAEVKERVPTHIVGDLDSLRPDVEDWYAKLGTEVVKMSSVNSNDFQKAMKVARGVRQEQELPTIVIGGHGGRMDQTLGNLNTLYASSENGEDMYWLERANAILSLSPGMHHISIDPSLEGPKCGLIPIGKPANSVSTEGLKWNLNAQELSFGIGGLISTSNEVVEPLVTVETSSPLMWTTELRL